MTTKTSMPPSKVAQRSKVQKTFVAAKLLSGFTDTNHFGMLTGEYLSSLTAAKRKHIEDEAIAARSYVSKLTPVNFANVERNLLTGDYFDAIKADPIFQRNFGALQYRFAEVDLRQLIALQPWVEPRHDKVPKNRKKLLEFALPRKWDVPTEVSVIHPQGPIQILTSDPALQSMEMEFDQSTGKITLAAGKHPNLIQVAHFSGRYCLRNGYHRVVDALDQGHQTLPALVWDSFSPDQMALPGHGMFTIPYVVAATSHGLRFCIAGRDLSEGSGAPLRDDHQPRYQTNQFWNLEAIVDGPRLKGDHRSAAHGGPEILHGTKHTLGVRLPLLAHLLRGLAFATPRRRWNTQLKTRRFMLPECLRLVCLWVPEPRQR